LEEPGYLFYANQKYVRAKQDPTFLIERGYMHRGCPALVFGHAVVIVKDGYSFLLLGSSIDGEYMKTKER